MEKRRTGIGWRAEAVQQYSGGTSQELERCSLSEIACQATINSSAMYVTCASRCSLSLIVHQAVGSTG